MVRLAEVLARTAVDGGIVDENVDGRIRKVGCQGIDRCPVGDVEFVCPRFEGLEFPSVGGPAAAGVHRPAVGGELPGEFEADAPARAGDEDGCHHGIASPL